MRKCEKCQYYDAGFCDLEFIEFGYRYPCNEDINCIDYKEDER